MRNSFFLAGTFALALTGSSASQGFDFASIEAAPSPSLTGPAIDLPSQTAVYDQASAVSVASAAATPESGAARRHFGWKDDVGPWGDDNIGPWKNKDCHDHPGHWCQRGWDWNGWECVPPRRPTWTRTVRTTVTATDCDTVTTGGHHTTHHHTRTRTRHTTNDHTRTRTHHTTRQTTTATPTVPSTCTPVSWTNTNAFTTASACPTPFEVGTYCGFINPQDPCVIQPGGYGPHVTPDTVEAFENYPEFQADAMNAVAPAGYVETFNNLNASVNANTYLGFKVLESYDVEGCASFCDETNLCTGFNIYIERDPSINPEQCSCTNPASITNYKCSIWGGGVDAEAANNFGQIRDDFQVVITASNGYTQGQQNAPMTPAGWTNPQPLSGAHHHPHSRIGEKFFPGPFDVSVCAAFACAHNSEHGHGRCSRGHGPKCNFFNAYLLTENGVPKGTYCSLFSQHHDPSEARWSPGWHDGDHWGVKNSWSYWLDDF